MTHTIPNYLRIHCGPDPSDPSPADPGRTCIENFWVSYAQATRWRIDPRNSGIGTPLKLLPVVHDCPEQEPDVAVSQADALRLAESAIAMALELDASRAALRRQEAELAARAAIIGGQAQQQTLADRIEQTLAGAAAACDCTAAAMYMLDDDTEFLKARAVFGLPASRLEQPQRPLRGSRGDLEAMVQGVVTIDDIRSTTLDTWNCPEEGDSIASAICAVISSDDVPIGTLWLFSNEKIEFGSAPIAAARMAAAQLSLLLHAAHHQQSQTAPKKPAAIQAVADWQCESLPVGTTLASGWFVDGMIDSPNPWAIGWHSWDVLPDGSLMIAIAEAQDWSLKGAMSATIARAALASHLGYRHSPSQLLQRINDTLWQTSTCEQLMSLLYVRVDPETGEGEFASAGSIAAMIGSRYGYRPLVEGQGAPLCSDFRASHVSDSFRMMPGETLLAYGLGMRGSEAASGATQRMLGDSIRAAMQQNDKHPLASIRRQLVGMPLGCERGAVTLVRGSREQGAGGR